MAMEFSSCPHCGIKLVQGAMRCVSCGRILKSPEDQMESINRVRQKKKSVNIGSMVKLSLLLIALIVAYTKFSPQITALIQRALGK